MLGTIVYLFHKSKSTTPSVSLQYVHAHYTRWRNNALQHHFTKHA